MTLEKYLSGSGILSAAIVFLALAWAFNIVFTTIMNVRAARKGHEEPLESIRGDIRALRNDLATDRERIAALERDMESHTGELKDMRKGQTELCRGVQALLDHALHDGNTEEMRAASDSIGKWLRTR